MIQNCQQITDFAPLEQLDNLSKLYLLDADINLIKNKKIN